MLRVVKVSLSLIMITALFNVLLTVSFSAQGDARKDVIQGVVSLVAQNVNYNARVALLVQQFVTIVPSLVLGQ